MKRNNTSKTPAVTKDQAVDIVAILKRMEELEERFTQLETTLKETVTFDTLAARLTGADKKTRKRTRAKREWTQEEKTAFHKRMVAARKAKQKAYQEAAKSEPDSKKY